MLQDVSYVSHYRFFPNWLREFDSPKWSDVSCYAKPSTSSIFCPQNPHPKRCQAAGLSRWRSALPPPCFADSGQLGASPRPIICPIFSPLAYASAETHGRIFLAAKRRFHPRRNLAGVPHDSGRISSRLQEERDHAVTSIPFLVYSCAPSSRFPSSRTTRSTNSSPPEPSNTPPVQPRRSSSGAPARTEHLYYTHGSTSLPPDSTQSTYRLSSPSTRNKFIIMGWFHSGNYFSSLMSCLSKPTRWTQCHRLTFIFRFSSSD